MSDEKAAVHKAMMRRVPNNVISVLIALCTIATFCGFQAFGMGRDDRATIAIRFFMAAGVLAGFSVLAMIANIRYSRYAMGNSRSPARKKDQTEKDNHSSLGS